MTMVSHSSRDRFVAAINGEPVDRVPIGPPFQGYWALQQAGVPVRTSIDKPQLAASAQLKAVERCAFDGFETMWDWLAPVEAVGCTVDMPDVGNPSTATHVVTSPSVLDSLEVPDPEKDYRLQSAMHTTSIIRNKLGSDKFLYTTLVSPFTLVGELRGVENLMLDMYDEPDFVHDMLSFAEDVVVRYSEYLTSWGVDGVILCDPTASADLISKEDFETFSKHYLKAPIKAIRDADAYVLLHICGNTSDRLDTIGELDIDVFSLDFLVDLAYAKETLGDSPTLLGNVNPAETLFNGTAEQVVREAQACIQKTDGKAFVLGAGCDIAPGSPMDNVEALKTVVARK
ncbi:hypothetical protein EF808_07110 [archaeon]|nr:MAG: hypothetical protein EF808_07110 [archaeon]